MVREFPLVVPFGVVLVSGIVVGSSHWLTTATEYFTDGVSWGILSGAYKGMCQVNFLLLSCVGCVNTQVQGAGDMLQLLLAH